MESDRGASCLAGAMLQIHQNSPTLLQSLSSAQPGSEEAGLFHGVASILMNFLIFSQFHCKFAGLKQYLLTCQCTPMPQCIHCCEATARGSRFIHPGMLLHAIRMADGFCVLRHTGCPNQVRDRGAGEQNLDVVYSCVSIQPAARCIHKLIVATHIAPIPG